MDSHSIYHTFYFLVPIFWNVQLRNWNSKIIPIAFNSMTWQSISDSNGKISYQTSGDPLWFLPKTSFTVKNRPYPSYILYSRGLLAGPKSYHFFGESKPHKSSKMDNTKCFLMLFSSKRVTWGRYKHYTWCKSTDREWSESWVCWKRLDSPLTAVSRTHYLGKVTRISLTLVQTE